MFEYVHIIFILSPYTKISLMYDTLQEAYIDFKVRKHNLILQGLRVAQAAVTERWP